MAQRGLEAHGVRGCGESLSGQGGGPQVGAGPPVWSSGRPLARKGCRAQNSLLRHTVFRSQGRCVFHADLRGRWGPPPALSEQGGAKAGWGGGEGLLLEAVVFGRGCVPGHPGPSAPPRGNIQKEESGNTELPEKHKEKNNHHPERSATFSSRCPSLLNFTHSCGRPAVLDLVFLFHVM